MKTESFKTQLTRAIAIITIVFIGTLIHNAAKAQNATTNLDKMQILKGWAGKWTGEGWMVDESRQRTEFTVEEHIQLKLDGRTILAEGVGKSKATGKEGFRSLGVFYYNNESKTYEVRSWLADGNMTTATAEITEDGLFVWGFEVPGGSIRYTIQIDGDTWNEKGEYVMASGQAFPVMEMNLTRLK